LRPVIGDRLPRSSPDEKLTHTASAGDVNYENLVVIKSQQVADSYLKEYRIIKTKRHK